MSFTNMTDVANRAMQHLGVTRIATLSDSSKQAKEANFAIDKVRQDILRRSVWSFAVRRAVLRNIVATTKPVNPVLYSNSQAYTLGDVVFDANNFAWISLGSQVGVAPSAQALGWTWTEYFGSGNAQVWDGVTKWLPGDLVYLSGGSVVYLCTAANTNFTPPNATYWHLVFGATLGPLTTGQLIFPLGYSPDGTKQRNFFGLPVNYLRIAPQDPKAAAVMHPNTTAGMQFNDWEIENNTVFTNDVDPHIIRFVADASDVFRMPALFCEVWAAQLAVSLNQAITQSHEKYVDIMVWYDRCLNMAKLTNAIESGSTEAEIPEGGGGQPAAGEAQGPRGR